MNESKTNVVMGILHAFALEAVRMKAIETIANAQCHNSEESQEEGRVDIDSIKMSANEFFLELEKTQFTSKDVELLVYRGRKTKIF
ncbi:hypothetical protein [Burkholderia dolosa]|uniref:hypothetical protein n=1 Tax=Burkholderia dolosa TaxID=152500 RepID=UPI0027D2CFA7|nr:hypothetical protein [Burkholderia dolosa]